MLMRTEGTATVKHKSVDISVSHVDVQAAVNNSGWYTVLWILSAFPTRKLKRGEMRQSL